MRIMVPNAPVLDYPEADRLLISGAASPAANRVRLPGPSRHGRVITLDEMPEDKVWEMVRLYGPVSKK